MVKSLVNQSTQQQISESSWLALHVTEPHGKDSDLIIIKLGLMTIDAYHHTLLHMQARCPKI